MSELYLSSYLQELKDLHSFVQCSLQGHSYAISAGKIADLIHKVANTGGTYHPLADISNYQSEKARIAELEEFAKNEIDKDHPYLFSIALTRLWTIIEAGANHIVTDLVKDRSRVFASSKLMTIKGPLINFIEMPDMDRVSYLKERLFHEMGTTNRYGIDKFEVVLKDLQLGGTVPKTIRKILNELCEKRNVIVHKCGIIDNRFQEKCPWVRSEIGEKLNPTYRDFRLCLDAAFWYLISLGLRISLAHDSDLDDKNEILSFLSTLETSISTAANRAEGV